MNLENLIRIIKAMFTKFVCQGSDGNIKLDNIINNDKYNKSLNFKENILTYKKGNKIKLSNKYCNIMELENNFLSVIRYI